MVPYEADPKRPYKMYATILVAMLWAFVGNEVVQASPWTVAIIGAVLAGLTAFITPNPAK